ncbi:MAG: hypothetical protein WAT74_05165, partial [Flavobacteriales bacterium]
TWAISITRWRIWSFQHVRNIHELLEAAESEGLIEPSGDWLERLEIRTRAQRECLRQLETRIAEPDSPADDISVPHESIIRYSKQKLTGGLLLAIALCCYLAYHYSNSGFDTITVAIVGAFVVYYAWFGVRRCFRNTVVLRVDSNAIVVKEVKRIPWDHLVRASVIQEKASDDTRNLLKIEHDQTTTEIDLEGVDITTEKLRHALKVHRYRWEQRHGVDLNPTFAP